VEASFLTRAAAEWLIANGAALADIDSVNIDDIDDRMRPSTRGYFGPVFRSSSISPVSTSFPLPLSLPCRATRIECFGTLPVRAYAMVRDRVRGACPPGPPISPQ
jgi:arylformamidase